MVNPWRALLFTAKYLWNWQLPIASWLRIRYLACRAFKKWITCLGVMHERSDSPCRFADGELFINRAHCRVGGDMTDGHTLLWLDKWTHSAVAWSGGFLKRGGYIRNYFDTPKSEVNVPGCTRYNLLLLHVCSKPLRDIDVLAFPIFCTWER